MGVSSTPPPPIGRFPYNWMIWWNKSVKWGTRFLLQNFVFLNINSLKIRLADFWTVSWLSLSSPYIIQWLWRKSSVIFITHIIIHEYKKWRHYKSLRLSIFLYRRVLLETRYKGTILFDLYPTLIIFVSRSINYVPLCRLRMSFFFCQLCSCLVRCLRTLSVTCMFLCDLYTDGDNTYPSNTPVSSR